MAAGEGGLVAILGKKLAGEVMNASKLGIKSSSAKKVANATEGAGNGAAKGGLKPLGLGSTAKAGVSRVNPVNLTEELALKEIMGNPSMGNIAKLKKGMTDSRWHQNDGWQKMTWNNGGVEIHYVGQWQNGVLKAVDDFKIIGK